MNKIVAIHQPNLFPWLGYFDKIARSDIFIFFDDVQFQKTGGVWTNRVKLLVGGDARWITAPIDRTYCGLRAINQIQFSKNDPWRLKLKKTLDLNYCKHPYFEETMHVLGPLLNYQDENLSDYNIHAIATLAEHLGLDSNKFRRSSECIGHGKSNELLCSLTRIVGGTAYMCGGGADTYQDRNVFNAAGLDLIYQNFEHPVYKQIGSDKFIPGLSVIDVLMNLGLQEVQGLLAS